MDYTVLSEVIKKHTKWLNSARNDGERAELCGEDLSNTDLKEMVLIDADFSGADLRGANLLKANLKDVNLKGAYLREANLRGANLIGADLMGANGIASSFREAFLREASFIEAHLIDADFREANCIEANFYHAKMIKADLRGTTAVDANFVEADLSNARMRSVNFRGADLRGAIFKDADLSFADFSYADLSGADLSDADLREAKFVRTNLHRTRFDNADLRMLRIDNDSCEQISNVIREQFERTWVYEKVKDHLLKSITILNSEFPAEYRNAALILLYNFPYILTQKEPGQKAKLSMEYDGNSMSLMVHMITGEIAEFHRALNEYAQVLAGKKSVGAYATDSLIKELFQNVIQLANFSIAPKSHHEKTDWAQANDHNDNLGIDLSKLHQIGNIILDIIIKEIRP